MQVTCLGHEIVGFLTHYLMEERATVPCSDDESCKWCQLHLGRRVKAFICAKQHPVGYLFALELTEGAWRAIEQNPISKPSLRGRVLKLKRKGDPRKGPVFAELDKQVDPNTLPEPFDLIPVLENAYNGSLRKVAIHELLNGPGQQIGQHEEEPNVHVIPADLPDPALVRVQWKPGMSVTQAWNDLRKSPESS